MGRLTSIKRGIERAQNSLDMSTAARMERARDQGFTEQVYHGTGNLEGFDRFDPEKAGLGADQFGPGFYLTTEPEEASGYAMDVARGQGTIQGESGAEMLNKKCGTEGNREIKKFRHH